MRARRYVICMRRFGGVIERRRRAEPRQKRAAGAQARSRRSTAAQARSQRARLRAAHTSTTSVQSQRAQPGAASVARACQGLMTASTMMRQMERRNIMAQHIHLRVFFCSSLAVVSALLPWFTKSFAFATCCTMFCKHVPRQHATHTKRHRLCMHAAAPATRCCPASRPEPPPAPPCPGRFGAGPAAVAPGPSPRCGAPGSPAPCLAPAGACGAKRAAQRAVSDEARCVWTRARPEQRTRANAMRVRTRRSGAHAGATRLAAPLLADGLLPDLLAFARLDHLLNLSLVRLRRQVTPHSATSAHAGVCRCACLQRKRKHNARTFFP